MFRILVLEDDNNKAQNITKIIYETGLTHKNVKTVPDSNSVRRELRQQYYDLVLLDLQVPVRFGERPVPNGGIELLNDILSNNIYI